MRTPRPNNNNTPTHQGPDEAEGRNHHGAVAAVKQIAATARLAHALKQQPAVPAELTPSFPPSPPLLVAGSPEPGAAHPPAIGIQWAQRCAEKHQGSNRPGQQQEPCTKPDTHHTNPTKGCSTTFHTHTHMRRA